MSTKMFIAVLLEPMNPSQLRLRSLMTSNIIYSEFQAINFKPTFLYIKKCKETGLLYFGKTVRKDVEKYTGSGTYWRRHVKIHGVTNIETIWYCLFTNIETLVEFATNFSNQENIVKSKDWANILPETGMNNTYIKESEERKIVRKENSSKGGIVCRDSKLGIFNKTKIDPHTRSKNSAATALKNGNHNLKNNHAKYKQKAMDTIRRNRELSGRENYNKNRNLMNHELIGNKYVIQELVPEYIEQGWHLGQIHSEKHKLSRQGKKRNNYKISIINIQKKLDYFGISNIEMALNMFCEFNINESSKYLDCLTMFNNLPIKPNYKRHTVTRLLALYNQIKKFNNQITESS